MREGLVSIVVPVYNVAKLLPRCLESLLNQTYPYIELLLIDDGSEDGSAEVCDSYKEIDSRVRVFHQPHQGVSTARNTGLDNANGEWIAFADADDWLDLDLIKRGTEAASMFQAEMAVCDVMHVMIEDEGIMTCKPQQLISAGTEPECYNDDMAYTKIIPYSGLITNKLYYYKCIQDLRFDVTIRYGEDLLFLAKTFERIQRITCVPGPYYYHVENRQGNVVSQKLNPRHLELLQATCLTYEIVRDSSRGHAAVARCLRSANIVMNKATATPSTEVAQYMTAIKQMLRSISSQDYRAYLHSMQYTKKDKLKLRLMRLNASLYLKIKKLGLGRL